MRQTLLICYCAWGCFEDSLSSHSLGGSWSKGSVPSWTGTGAAELGSPAQDLPYKETTG